MLQSISFRRVVANRGDLNTKNIITPVLASPSTSLVMVMAIRQDNLPAHGC